MVNQHSATADLQRITEHLKTVESSPWRWMFYGDSVTHGAAHTDGWRSFPEIFAERLRWEIQLEPGFHSMALDIVINNAYSGWTTAELLEHYNTQIREFHPSFVSIMIGMNDMVRPGIPSIFEENLRKLVELIREDEAIPLLHTCNPIIPMTEAYQMRFDRMENYTEITCRIAADCDVLLVDNYAHWPKLETNPEELKKWLGEPIHPGGRGHLEIARLMLKVLGMDSETSGCLHPAGLLS